MRNARYDCNHCKQTRNVGLDTDTHVQLIEKSANGLVMYSDSHRCENGIIGINNLQIDSHFDVRGLHFSSYLNAKFLNYRVLEYLSLMQRYPMK